MYNGAKNNDLAGTRKHVHTTASSWYTALRAMNFSLGSTAHERFTKIYKYMNL